VPTAQVPTAYVGTAGWSIHSQYLAQFPPGGTHLERYARGLNAVEINSSFYRPHRRATYERWAASVGPAFRFSVKVPKAITHERKLVDCDDLLDRFLDETAGLAEKLGVLLVQLPPSFAFDAAVAGAFFRDLRRRTPVAIACEPRHATWFTPACDALLSKHRIARVAADPARVPNAGLPGGWPGLAYFRWHGTPRLYWSDYDAEALNRLVDQMARQRTNGAVTWCIFDNTAQSFALGNAISVTGAVS
jgi:uncharacterized protein YecE (DUF72 family)